MDSEEFAAGLRDPEKAASVCVAMSLRLQAARETLAQVAQGKGRQFTLEEREALFDTAIDLLRLALKL